ncbi:hypothetical protein EV401DRAFT_1183631 [Pisolithus croceorrhizus]|nr:hypothetical protein EV401DRAFT_1183631 [Pisolithus croceorrhizus]
MYRASEKKKKPCVHTYPTYGIGWTFHLENLEIMDRIGRSVIASTCYISLTTSLSMGSSLPSDINIAAVYTLIVAVTKSSRTLVAVLVHYCFARYSLQQLFRISHQGHMRVQGRIQLEGRTWLVGSPYRKSNLLHVHGVFPVQISVTFPRPFAD